MDELNKETINMNEAKEKAMKRVVEICVEQLGVDAEDVTEDKAFVEDLNADSLDQTELVMTLEEELDIDIPEDVAEKLKTVGDVVDFIIRVKTC